MQNIIRTGNGEQRAPTIKSEGTRLRALRGLLRWGPLRELEERVMGFEPCFDVLENKDAYIFKADLPGVRPDGLDLSINRRRLIVSGRRNGERIEMEERAEVYAIAERPHGHFSRTFLLPDDVDPGTIRAELKDGVLTIRLARILEAEARRIDIQASDRGAEAVSAERVPGGRGRAGERAAAELKS